MAGSEIDALIHLLARLPGLGPRSARRAVLHLMRKRDTLLAPLAEAMQAARQAVGECSTCGNIDTHDPCAICTDTRRDRTRICVVETVGDLWALERAAAMGGLYHVLGGTLSALDGVGPDDLNIERLVARCRDGEITEIILATNATVEGQTTAHYILDRLQGLAVTVSRLAHGIPVGGELDYLDDGTLSQAIKSRRQI